MHKIRLWFNITSFYSSLFQFLPFRDEIIFSSNTGYTIVINGVLLTGTMNNQNEKIILP